MSDTDSDDSSSSSEAYSNDDTSNSSDNASHTSSFSTYEVNVKALKHERYENMSVTYDDDKSFLLNHTHEDQQGTCLFMYPIALTPDRNYFEIQITGLGRIKAVGVGLAHPHYRLDRMPGWDRNSIGYHSDDGKLYRKGNCANGTGFGPKCHELDRMGCGINFGGIASVDLFTKRAKVGVFFTKNGARVGRMVTRHYPPDGFFPVLGMQSRGDSAILFPPEPYLERPLSLGLGLGLKSGGNSMMLVDSFEEQASEWAVLNNLQCCHDTLRFIGEPNEDTVGLAIASWCLSRKRPYFEIEIVRTTLKCTTMIGVANSRHPLTSLPGRSHQSIAYQTDTGHLLGRKIPRDKSGPVCRQGSRIGVMLRFPRTAEERSSCLVVNGVALKADEEGKKDEKEVKDEEDTNDDGMDDDSADGDGDENDEDDDSDDEDHDQDDDDDDYDAKKEKKDDKESENETSLLFFVDGKLAVTIPLESSVKAELYRPAVGFSKAGQIIRYDFNALSG